MVARVKKNDTVVVISGKDRGKQGPVLEILPKKNAVVIKDVAIVTRHVKARAQGQTAGIKKQEAYIDLSKVMPICSSCKKPCRIQIKVIEGNINARSCHRCKEVF